MRKSSIYDERDTDSRNSESPPNRSRLDTVERGRAKKHSNDDYDDDEMVSTYSNVSAKKKESDSLFARYTDLMVLHPLPMNALQAFVITAMSVLISQRISGMEYTDWYEVLNAALVSSLWITPILLTWFRVMSKMPIGTIGKIVFDQLCFSPIFTATIVSWRTLLSGKVYYTQLPSYLFVMIPRTILTSWTFWIPARALTYSTIIPPHLRLIATSILSFIWNIVLAILLRQ